eukprot:TRINITY_DN1223_c0_g1_i2.p1 TRINITY_DN1223_c0_g1~~TRINITY_DN1223_c0_g1_i2.p1  ORF type:complete len:438 (-),score=85.81 TRINITY_DN1223_c0_g1_i2:185-1345(-)
MAVPTRAVTFLVLIFSSSLFCLHLITNRRAATASITELTHQQALLEARIDRLNSNHPEDGPERAPWSRELYEALQCQLSAEVKTQPEPQPYVYYKPNTPKKQLPPNHKHFIYLIQAPEWPPITSQLASDDADVMILTWKDPIDLQEIQKQPDVLGSADINAISTIHHPGSSWNQGRNKLLAETVERANARGWNYTYFIFLDDDVETICHHGKHPTRGCWPVFESFLLEYEPAVGVLPISHGVSGTTQVISVYYADAAANAFHVEAVSFILPYPEQFDDISWWYSQVCIMHRSAVHFANHILQCNTIQTNNLAHRHYPRSGEWDVATEWQKAQLPENMRPMVRNKFHQFDPGRGLIGETRKKGNRRYDVLCPIEKFNNKKKSDGPAS